MSIYTKLAEARVKLQAEPLKKSGKNHFVKIKTKEKDDRGYYKEDPMPYFELGDFLPAINLIFNELKMCGVVSFTDKQATLTIFDGESDQKIEFTSPMPTLMQNEKSTSNRLMQDIGGLQTYQRRYLYVSALEIVENDVIDSVDFKNTNEKQQQQQQQQQQGKAPEQTLQGFIEAVSKAQSKGEVEKYWQAVRQKLANHPQLLATANDHYQARKGDFELMEM